MGNLDTSRAGREKNHLGLEDIKPGSWGEDLLAEETIIRLVDFAYDPFGSQENLDELAQLRRRRPSQDGQTKPRSRGSRRLALCEEPAKLHQGRIIEEWADRSLSPESGGIPSLVCCQSLECPEEAGKKVNPGGRVTHQIGQENVRMWLSINHGSCGGHTPPV